jgi:hypothetical protein
MKINSSDSDNLYSPIQMSNVGGHTQDGPKAALVAISPSPAELAYTWTRVAVGSE